MTKKRSKEKKDFEISIESINDISFYCNTEYDYDSLNENILNLSFKQNFNIDSKKELLGISIGILFIDARDNTKIFEKSILVNFKITDIDNFIHSTENSFTTEYDELLFKLMNIAVGTLRGAMFIENRNTPLAKYPLPIISDELLKKIIEVASEA